MVWRLAPFLWSLCRGDENDVENLVKTRLGAGKANYCLFRNCRLRLGESGPAIVLPKVATVFGGSVLSWKTLCRDR